MKKVKQKKVLGFIGNVVNAGATIASSVIGANAQKQMQQAELASQERMMQAQLDAQKRQMSNNNAMAFLNTMNQQNNQDMSAQYNRFNPILKMGGKRVKRCKLGTFKDRF